jgi:hypothetical protein
VKSLLVVSLTAVGVMGSWIGPAPLDPGDARLEALMTGAALLMLATVFRRLAGSGRVR